MKENVYESVGLPVMTSSEEGAVSHVMTATEHGAVSHVMAATEHGAVPHVMTATEQAAVPHVMIDDGGLLEEMGLKKFESEEGKVNVDHCTTAL